MSSVGIPSARHVHTCPVETTKMVKGMEHMTDMEGLR